MTRLKLLMTACFTAVLATFIGLTGLAQDFNVNQRTFLTFSAPVELPGVTLQPGKYLFRLVDSPSTRNIVQVYNEDETKLYATILAISAERLEAEGETVVTFGERAAGQPPAVKYWYYPGRLIGHEFVYPKDQALRIARDTNQEVLAGASNDRDAALTRISPSGEETAYNENERAGERTGEAAPSSTGDQAASRSTPDQSTADQSMSGQSMSDQSMSGTATSQPSTPATASASAGQQATTDREPSMTPDQHAAMVNERAGQATGTSGRQSAEDREDQTAGTSGRADNQVAGQTMARNELPQTASPLPLAGLIGLLSLGGAFGLRRARR